MRFASIAAPSPWACRVLVYPPGFRPIARAASITLAVKNADEVVPIINAVSKHFGFVVMTQDWHTPGHASFASSRPGKKPFETTSLAYG
jgi:nicotinamidase-related amidase